MLRLLRKKLPGLNQNIQSLRQRTKIRNKPWYLEKRFSSYSEDDLFNIKLMRKQVRERVPGMTMRSQRGLFHGKKKRKGHSTCFSEKKTLRYFKPNVQLKNFRSNFLQRNIRVHVTTTTIKKIRHYGGIDNYLLLAYSKNMWSNLGEYLRRVMLLKLKKPNLNLEGRKIMGMEENLFKNKRSLKQIKNPVSLQGSLRHKDLTYLKSKKPDDYTRRELKILKAYFEGEEEFEQYKEEVQEMNDREDKALDLGEEEKSRIVPKIEKWLAKKAKESPKFYKMYLLQTHDSSQNSELYQTPILENPNKI